MTHEQIIPITFICIDVLLALFATLLYLCEESVNINDWKDVASCLGIFLFGLIFWPVFFYEASDRARHIFYYECKNRILKIIKYMLYISPIASLGLLWII